MYKMWYEQLKIWGWLYSVCSILYLKCFGADTMYKVPESIFFFKEFFKDTTWEGVRQDMDAIKI